MTLCTGVLLAAGRGRRAGGSKQLLPWVTAAGVLPLAAASFDSVAPACSAMLVVLGHEAQAVQAALGSRPFQTVISQPDAPMGESIRAGLRAALSRDPNRPILLHLGDHPLLQRATLIRIVAEAARAPSLAVIPEFNGRGGHPAIIPPNLARRVIADPLEQGLRAFWASHALECRRIPLADPGVLSDVDRFPGRAPPVPHAPPA